ncbi:MAG: hypothetical protein U0Y96_07345 [Candidatus Kapaibacterium sp.]
MKKLLLCIVVFCSTTIVYTQVQNKQEREQEGTPYERYEWDVQRLQDPQTNQIPDNIYTLEKQFAQQLSKQSKTSPTLQTYSYIDVHPIGPNNVGGRTRAIAIDRTHPNIILTGGVTGGIWRSIDTGATWTRVSDFKDIQNVSCIVQSASPADGSVWYAGTGEMLSTTERRTSTNLRTIGTGSGIYRSTDRGLTWSQIPGTEVRTQRNKLGSPFCITWKLHPIEYNKDGIPVDGVIACCYGGVYSITYKPTLTITPIVTDSSKPFINSDVVSSGKNYFIAISSADDGSKPSVFGVWKLDVTTNQFTNITPVNYPAQVRRIKLAIAPSDGKIVYMYTDTPTNWNLRYQDFGSSYKLWRYDDKTEGAGIWTDRTRWITTMNKNDDSFRSLAAYAMCLVVHPTNSSTVYLGGTNLCRTTSGFSDTNDIMKIGGYPYIVAPGRLHPDIHNLLFAPNNKQLYATCDGGVFVLDNPMINTEAGWRDRNTGLITTQVYGASLNRFIPNDNTVIVGLQDNSNFVTKTSKVNKGWEFGGGGDGCTTDIFKTGSVFFASSQQGYIHALKRDQLGELQYTNFSPPNQINSIPNRAFVTLQKLSPDFSYLYLALGNKLFRYKNPENALDDVLEHSLLWEEIKTIGTSLPTSQQITAIAFSTSNPELMYLGTNGGKLYIVLTINNQSTVEELTSPTFPTNAFVSSIDVDPRNENHIIISFSNYNVESVFITTDGGDTWKKFGLNLEDQNKTLGWGPSVRCVKIIPVNQNESLYLAGTSIGLFSHLTADTSKPWVLESANVLGNITIESMDYRTSDNRLILGTHGAGVYSGTITFSQTSVDDTPSDYYSLCAITPNPTTTIPTIQCSLPTQQSVSFHLYNSIGELVTSLPEQSYTSGKHSITFNTSGIVSLPSDVYYVKMITPSFTTTTSFILVK